MNTLNSIIIEGNVVRDSTTRTTTRSLVCVFSIASNRTYRSGSDFEKETSFFEVEAWGKLAEYCKEQCLKGQAVRVVGRLKQSRWTDSEGKNHSKVTIVAEHVEAKAKKTDFPPVNAEVSTYAKENVEEVSSIAF